MIDNLLKALNEAGLYIGKCKGIDDLTAAVAWHLAYKNSVELAVKMHPEETGAQILARVEAAMKHFNEAP